MSTPIKTGAWLFLKQHGTYLRCDLYEYRDTVLIARANPLSLTREPPPEEGLWATMRDYEDHWITDDVHTYVSTDYDLHYMMQFLSGRWHDVKLSDPYRKPTKPQGE